MVFFKSAVLSICLTLLFCSAVEVRASLSTYKIRGGYIAMYNEDSTRFIRRDSEWGTTIGTYIIVGEGYCRDSQDNDRKLYCLQRLFVTTSEYAAHYEFRGSYFVRMDAERVRMDEVTYKNMISHAEPPYIDVIVFHGESWSNEYNEWGYGYLHYILEPGATRVPVVDAFSWIPFQRSDPDRYEPEIVAGDWLSTSQKLELSDFRCHTQSFGSNTMCHQYLWTAHTAVVDYKYNNSLSTIDASHETVLDSVVLENYGHGIGGTNLALVGSQETNTIESSAVFSSNYGVHVEESKEVILDISLITENGQASLDRGRKKSSTSGSEFSFGSDLTRTATSVSTKDVKWPSDCALGIRKTVALIENTKTLSVPVTFILERAGSTWTEENSLEVTLKSVVIRNTVCCLYRDASEDCGTEYTPMCDPDANDVFSTDASAVNGG